MRMVFIHLTSILLCLITTVPCLAQAAAEEGSDGKSYVSSYFVVGLGIALGLVAICRPGKRNKEVRRPEA